MNPIPTSGGRSLLRAPAAPRRAAAAAACLSALALALPASGAASGAAYHVDGASVGGACSDARTPAENTVSTPWCTIRAALEKAPAGSTVLVRRGQYARVVASDVARSAYVTVKPHPGEAPRIDGMDLSRVDHLRLEGLTLTSGVVVRGGQHLQFVGNDVVLTPAGKRTSSGFILASVKTVLLRGNRVADGWDGVNLLGSTPGSSEVVVWGNHFQRLGNDAVHIGAQASRVLVGANFMDDCRLRQDIDPTAHADGIQAMGPTQDVTVWGNVVTGGRGFLFMVSPRDQGRPGHGHRGTVIANNVLLGREFGVRTFSTPAALIVNNTIWGLSSSEGSSLTVNDRVGTTNDRSAGVTVANNVLKRFKVNPRVSFAARDHNVIQQGPMGGARDVIGTPRFVAPERGDFRLAAGSLGVDGGHPAWAPAVDVQGRARAGRPDAGAFEAGGPLAASVSHGMPARVGALLEATGAADGAAGLAALPLAR